ncbi:MAG TPA: thioredoxin family protein [Agriterribacter sp.]|nr:thioredoxin family protein [Agriterribacter sp.]
MKKLFTCFVFVLSITFVANAQPASADQILKEARTAAAKENKKIFVIFHASWCVWCHKMDSAMNDPACSAFFENNFIITHLVVMESKGKEHLENPGAMDLMNKYTGGNSGIPFWLIFDSEGKLLADSKIRPAGASLDAPGENSGCPASEKEVANFIQVLQQTTSLDQQQLSIIQNRFRQNESK